LTKGSANIAISARSWERLRRHLLGSDVEEVAIAYSEFRSGSPSEFVVRTLELMAESDFERRSQFHVSLTDDALARVIKRAWDLRLSIVELHSHPGTDEAAFSPSDLAGLRDLVPHIWWRLRGAPYAAIVVTTAEIDALAWTASAEHAEPIEAVVAGKTILRPSGRTLRQTRGCR
jgi:hypothetical protein